MVTSPDEPLIRHSPSTGPRSPDVWGVYEPDTGSIQYVCADPATAKAALIDVVWNLEPASLRTSTRAIEHVLGLVEREGLAVEWVLDTHPHADHLMASAQLAERTGAPDAIGEKVLEIAELWRGLLNTSDAFDPERDFARLLADGDTFRVGELELRVMLSPGHTLGSITCLAGDVAFVHDTLMQPDSGTARADFPGGSTAELRDSIRTILALPSETRLFVGHDYGAGRAARARMAAPRFSGARIVGRGAPSPRAAAVDAARSRAVLRGLRRLGRRGAVGDMAALTHGSSLRD